MVWLLYLSLFSFISNVISNNLFLILFKFSFHVALPILQTPHPHNNVFIHTHTSVLLSTPKRLFETCQIHFRKFQVHLTTKTSRTPN
jgi:hypothetical protein